MREEQAGRERAGYGENLLMRLSDDHREFYARMAAMGRWGSRELERQVNSMLHERAGWPRRPEGLLAELPQAGPPATILDDAFRDPYVLDFLGLADTSSEEDLEAALVRNIEQFMLEVGAGFCFIGRQRRLTIGDVDY